MNNSYVIHRLNEWSLDKIRREDSGLGWPSKSPFADGMPIGECGTVYAPNISEACFEVDKCVCALRVVDETLYEVVMLTYVFRSVLPEQRLKRLACCQRTYYNYLDRAHRLVQDYLSDIAVGIALPRLDVKMVA